MDLNFFSALLFLPREDVEEGFWLLCFFFLPLSILLLLESFQRDSLFFLPFSALFTQRNYSNRKLRSRGRTTYVVLTLFVNRCRHDLKRRRYLNSHRFAHCLWTFSFVDRGENVWHRGWRRKKLRFLHDFGYWRVKFTPVLRLQIEQGRTRWRRGVWQVNHGVMWRWLRGARRIRWSTYIQILESVPVVCNCRSFRGSAWRRWCNVSSACKQYHWFIANLRALLNFAVENPVLVPNFLFVSNHIVQLVTQVVVEHDSRCWRPWLLDSLPIFNLDVAASFRDVSTTTNIAELHKQSIRRRGRLVTIFNLIRRLRSLHSVSQILCDVLPDRVQVADTLHAFVFRKQADVFPRLSCS